MCLIVWDGHGWVGVGWDWDWFGPISIMNGVQKVWREIKLKQILKVGDSLVEMVLSAADQQQQQLVEVFYY